MRIVIVGAGPAGASLALLLARHGAQVRLLEREESAGAAFRGEGLMPLGIDALKEMGLGDVLAAVPGRAVSSWRIHIDGEEVFRIPEPVAELGDRGFRVASPAALLDRIIDAARAHPGFTYHPGTRFAGPVRDASGRVVGVRAVQPEGETEWPADLVVGCDGRGSSVRRHCDLPLDRSAEDYDVLWFKAPGLPAAEARTDFHIMVVRGRHPLVAYTSWDDRIQCGLIMPKGGLAEIARGDWLHTAVQSAPSRLAEHLLAHREQVVGPIRLAVMVGLAPRWSAPGVLLLGDAAHPMSPVRAQGINLALRDVVVAANHLVPLAAGPADPRAVDAACRAVQAEREPEIRRAQLLQRREARGQGDARAATWRYALAKRGARALGRYGWAQRAWLARQRELRFGSTDVRLTVPLPGPGGPIDGIVRPPSSARP